MVSHELQTPSETPDIIIDSNSPFSPYMLPRDSYSGPKHTDDVDYNQICATRAASTPLTPEELGLVRGHLGDMFHEEASGSLRWHSTFRTGWARNLEMALAPQQHQDNGTMRWFPDICDYANKQTAVYFVGDRAGDRHGYTDRRLGCYIYRTWHALHGGRPNLQRQHYFAKALRVPESEAASWSVPGLVAVHRRLCDATAARLGTEVVRLLCKDTADADSTFPPPDGAARTWREHGLSLHHLFRAVVLVADEHVLPVECPVQPVPEIRGHNQHWKVAAWLERLMPECSVLMVRTGDDEHLSRPVSFEGLVRDGKTVPLGLEEGKMAREFGVVRVKVEVAMRFLFELQAEEEAAFPSLRRGSGMLTEERESACHAWVESVLQHASLEEVGVDGNLYTWEAVRRMWAERDGEIFNQGAQDETRLAPLYSWYGLR
ncbi:uncharacterized protein F4807DRAFT_260711 [Annulohypoxylon truncatum]|uniref:uncharacterized protein n=1 Tax=Annulohypoxylon truncatum TaxID=327061 RepID=UPI002008CC13|nr:uncharacterized protein F4807DRAFT_260711 [Annulohypoxylon truncatum]KAI1213326.1 hypothetical protein F4807DRAFT_260711 [Annulohypoxylon truncatum]